MEPGDLNQLYDEAILQENRQPYHYEKRPDADVTLEAYNPLCGDQFKLFLFTSDNSISAAYFHGYGCAVSKASTSILVRELEGMSIAEAKRKCKNFSHWLTQKSDASFPLPTSWKPFAAVRQFPGRLSCAQLAWELILAEL